MTIEDLKGIVHSDPEIMGVYARVTVPNGTVAINKNSALVGTGASDQFILNSGGLA